LIYFIKDNTIPKIAILTPQFYQYDGNRCLFGGGERYLIDFAKLLINIGYSPEVFQASAEPWKKEYDGVSINGIYGGKVNKDFFINLNREFAIVTRDYNYHVYFNMDTLYPYVFPNSICISHGIWWDSLGRKWWRTKTWYDFLFSGLNAIDLLVSVDTNVINWINAVKPELKCKKTYIPNYVDTNVFKPDNKKTNNNIKILYPRRLCKARGWNVCRDVALELTSEYNNVVFSFVGRDTERKEKYMEMLSLENKQIEYTWYEMNDMYKAYEDTDIVLIPSLYAEGTSLSLLEAMACGKPVIAGIVGGLTDLVLQGYNGYLIEINKENLKGSIIELINKPKLRKELGKNAREVSKKFSKEIWETRWKKLIDTQLGR
jgi:glycosyltransferase involved in cell wall biosynthesis